MDSFVSFRQRFLWIMILNCLSSISIAAHYLIVPQCLLSKKLSFKTLAKEANLHLIQTEDLLAFQTQRRQKKIDCRGFIDVTSAIANSKWENHGDFLQSFIPVTHPSDFNRRYKIKHKSTVENLIEKIDKKILMHGLIKLTKWPDRNVNSLTGRLAAEWIKQTLMTYAGNDNYIKIFTIATFSDTNQPSIVLRIGEEENHEDAIVLGTHFDTIPKIDTVQPGANNNASGTMTLLETARILMASRLAFKKPIYLIWYAGSEAGKLGSQNVIAYFNQAGIPIDAVLQLGQTGYRKQAGTEIGLSDDFTDAGLNVFMADLVANYIKLPVGAVHCDYACSDHVLWYQNGNRVTYPTASLREEGNPFIHTAKDTLNTLSLDQISDFIKLSLAFTIELAEPLSQ